MSLLTFVANIIIIDALEANYPEDFNAKDEISKEATPEEISVVQVEESRQVNYIL